MVDKAHALRSDRHAEKDLQQHSQYDGNTQGCRNECSQGDGE